MDGPTSPLAFVSKRCFSSWYATGSNEVMALRRRTIYKLICGLRDNAAMLLLTHRMLQDFIKNYINRKLNGSPTLKGTCGGVELRLFRGVVILRDLHLTNVLADTRLAHIDCREVAIHIRWRGLLHGNFVGSVHLNSPRFEILAIGEDGDQTDVVSLLDPNLHRLMPFRLRSLKVEDASITYVSQFTNPPFKLKLDQLSLSATNLTNMQTPVPEVPAQVEAQGRTSGNGVFKMQMTLPSLSDATNFDFKAELQQVDLTDLNGVLRAYVKFDVAKGTCSLYSEIHSKNSRCEGFVQSHFRDLDLLAWQKEKDKIFFQICRQAALAVSAHLLIKDHARGELSLKVPISGTLAKANVGIGSAIRNLLKHVFLQSLLPRLKGDLPRKFPIV